MKVKILGVTTEMDLEEFASPEMAEMHKDCVSRTIQKIKDAKDEPDSYEGLRLQCQAVVDAFVELFGEKDAREILGKRTNLFRCLDAFDEMVALYDRQVVPALKKRGEKYGRARLNGR